MLITPESSANNSPIDGKRNGIDATTAVATIDTNALMDAIAELSSGNEYLPPASHYPLGAVYSDYFGGKYDENNKPL